MPNRTQNRRPSIVVAVRRVVAGPRPEFVRVGPTPVWMERLEERRVLSAATKIMADPDVLAPDDVVNCPAIDVDLGSDPSTGGEVVIDDGEMGSTTVDDGADWVVTDKTITVNGVFDVVDDDGNVVQSYRIVQTYYQVDGGGSTLDGGYWQVNVNDLDWSVPAGVEQGQSVLVTYDDETGMPTKEVAALPPSADEGSYYARLTRVATDTPDIVAQRDAFNTDGDGSEWDDGVLLGGGTDDGTDGGWIDDGEFVGVSGPTSEKTLSSTYLDVVDDEGNVVQSYKITNTTFGNWCIDSVDYMQVNLADLPDSVPATLEQGQSVLFTWDDDTGELKVVDALPETAESGTWYSQATRIGTDDADAVAARDNDTSGWINDGEWPVDFERGEVINVSVNESTGGVIYTMTGNPAAESTPPSSDANSPESGHVPQIPMPALPTADARALSEVLASGTKKHDILDDSATPLIAVVQ